MKHLIEANQEKARQAPVNAILSYDKAWIDRADVFNPRAAETIRNYCTTEEVVTFAAQQSANLQAGYFMTAVRALGLDAGPLWADFEGLYEEFFCGDRRASHPCGESRVRCSYPAPARYSGRMRRGDPQPLNTVFCVC